MKRPPAPATAEHDRSSTARPVALGVTPFTDPSRRLSVAPLTAGIIVAVMGLVLFLAFLQWRGTGIGDLLLRSNHRAMGPVITEQAASADSSVATQGTFPPTVAQIHSDGKSHSLLNVIPPRRRGPGAPGRAAAGDVEDGNEQADTADVTVTTPTGAAAPAADPVEQSAAAIELQAADALQTAEDQAADIESRAETAQERVGTAADALEAQAERARTIAEAGVEAGRLAPRAVEEARQLELQAQLQADRMRQQASDAYNRELARAEQIRTNARQAELRARQRAQQLRATGR